MPYLPLAVIPHPVGGQNPKDVMAKADAVVDEVVYVLTQPLEQLAKEYRGRFAEPRSRLRPKPLFR